ncbi:hypothetical protein ANN_00525 [Periplaneta americana]|uniref:HAT C-terminal dimerisation domain-containing protein n=1 Tax=Periplaneta americana TaxID=6978 RepID=A0ABQ8TV18_PERAM|nr:hypothetical protein ANN_00525 [Periplaneta americana]
MFAQQKCAKQSQKVDHEKQTKAEMLVALKRLIKTSPRTIFTNVWDRCPPSIVMHLGSCDRDGNHWVPGQGFRKAGSVPPTRSTKPTPVSVTSHSHRTPQKIDDEFLLNLVIPPLVAITAATCQACSPLVCVGYPLNASPFLLQYGSQLDNGSWPHFPKPQSPVQFVSKSLADFDRTISSLTSVPRNVGDKVNEKTANILSKNPGYYQLTEIQDILRRKTLQKPKKKVSIEQLTAFVQAPLTSCDVERSFSRYKAMLRDNRRRMTTENIRHCLVMNCNSINGTLSNEANTSKLMD